MKQLRDVRVAVLAVGAIASVLVAAAMHVPARDAAQLLGATAAGSLVAAIGGQWLLSRWSRNSLRNQILWVSATAVATVVVGIVAAARAMFISVHDLHALFVVTILAAAVSVAAALSLTAKFHTDTRAVTQVARRLVDRPGADTPQAPRFGIPEMRELSARLEEASALLERSRAREQALERSRRELVAWVSHDLRSPLASIRALSEALEDGIAATDDDRARYYRSIRQESERLAGLVDDLFELSRIQAGSPRPAPVPAPVQELIADSLDGVTPAAEIKGVRIEVDVEGIEDRLVPAADVVRVVRNLLDNAVRHTPLGGVVRLEGRSDGASVVLCVTDECGGIPESDLERVFDTAFRGDVSRGRDGGGGGLGLAIARGLVESHAGEIDVCNQPGGCQFRVRIPAR